MKALSAIQHCIQQNQLDYSHFTLARFLSELYPQAQAFDLWLSVLLNLEIARGNVCLALSDISEKSRQLGWRQLPDADELIQRIEQSPLVGGDDNDKPLIAYDNRLYLNRHFHNEKNIAQNLLARATASSEPCSREQVEQFFDSAKKEDVDFQKLAAIVSSLHQLAIISGGPGTGKTWTVSRLLALLLQQNAQLKISLAAPTGKAAARMAESIQGSLQQLDLAADLAQQFPAKAVTLHRLLHIDRYTHRPRYQAKNPLQCDVLVLDEASMIDQQMMAMICAALPAHCKLILLGDKDQLASVEAGSVFADLCGGLTQSEFSAEQCALLQQQYGLTLPQHSADYALADHVVVLQKSHRFDEHSGIGKLARLINNGDAEHSIDLLRQSSASEEAALLRWRQPATAELPQRLQQQALGDSLAMMQAQSIAQAFEFFHHSQILSAVWKGPGGVDAINAIIEQTLKQKMSIDSAQDFYRGKPLMMTSNVYQYGIHNGDIGIVWPDRDGELKVWFELAAGEYRKLSISQCPHYKTAYAMTVHKSQGSEFRHVLLLLPDNNSAVATRELFYTGITRAAQSVEIWAAESALRNAIERKTERVSGLLDRLKSHAEL